MFREVSENELSHELQVELINSIKDFNKNFLAQQSQGKFKAKVYQVTSTMIAGLKINIEDIFGAKGISVSIRNQAVSADIFVGINDSADDTYEDASISAGDKIDVAYTSPQIEFIHLISKGTSTVKVYIGV